MKQGTPFWVWQEVNENWFHKMFKFPTEGKDITEQILATEEINPKEQDQSWELQLGIKVGKLAIWVTLCVIENQVYHFHQKRLVSPYDGSWTKSPKTHILADGLIKSISSMLDEITSRTVCKNRAVINRGKKRIDSRKGSHPMKFKNRSQILVKQMVRDFCDSKLSGLHPFDNMARS